AAPPAKQNATAAPPAPADRKVPVLMPAARRAAEEQGVDPSRVSGTGRGGRILKEDVRPAGRQPAKPAAQPGVAASDQKPDGEVGKLSYDRVSDRRETRVRMTGIRQRIAERLVQSQQTTATLTTFNEADLSALMALREKYKDKFKERHGVGLGFMSFFVKAAVEALRAFPVVNSRIDGGDVVQQHFYDIGVAVSTERGLMVPIVHDVDQLTFAEIEKQVAELAAKARDGKIAVSDLQGGTFTITNGGVFGSLLSTPILNPPQSAI